MTRPWKLTWGARAWSLEKGVVGATPVTAGQVAQVMAELGEDTWDVMDAARSPNTVLTWLSVLLADDGPAYAEVLATPAADILTTLTFTDDQVGD